MVREVDCLVFVVAEDAAFELTRDRHSVPPFGSRSSRKKGGLTFSLSGAKKVASKKLRTQKGSLFCVFKTGLGAWGRGHMRFSRSPGHFAFCFFPRGTGASVNESK